MPLSVQVMESRNEMGVEEVAAIEEIDPFSLARLEPLVARSGRARESLMQQRHVGTALDVLFAELIRSVCAFIVHNNHLLGLHAPLHDGVECFSYVFSSVLDGHNYRYFHAHIGFGGKDRKLSGKWKKKSEKNEGRCSPMALELAGLHALEGAL
jgi:hypothetical protein